MDKETFLKTLDKNQADKLEEDKRQQDHQLADNRTQSLQDTIVRATNALIKFHQKNPAQVNISSNGKNIQLPKVDQTQVIKLLGELKDAISQLPANMPPMPEVPVPPDKVAVTNHPDYKPDFQKLAKSMPKFDPQPIVKAVAEATKAINDIQIPETETPDNTPLIDAINAVQDTIANLSFPVPNYVLPFQTTSGKATQITLSTDGKLPVSGGGDGAIEDGVDSTIRATVFKYTDSNPQAVRLTDTNGDYVAAGAGTQYTDGGTPPAHPVGGAIVYNNAGTWAAVSGSNKLPVNTGLTQPTTPSDTQPVSGTFWQATQPVSGTITANAGTNLNTSLLALESGGNLATLAGIVSSSKAATKIADGDSVTLGAKADAKSTATDTTAVSIVSVLKEISYMEQNPASRAVTNAGTFPVQNTPVASTGLYYGKKTVTTAGTRVALASSQAVKSVVIKALQTNTGYIYVGDSSVASTNGFQLLAGDTVSLDIANLSTVNIDSSVNGEGVTYIGSN